MTTWDSAIKVTIEINDFETLALFVEFLAAKGFKVKSKDDPTLVRKSSEPATGESQS